MFERFTDQARRVVVLAQEEARALNHAFIGTEHLLLGLLRAPGTAGEALQASGITSEAARQQVESTVGRGKQAPSGHVPFTSRAKNILQLTAREADDRGGESIRSGHILLAILREGQGVAVQVITGLGADAGDLRSKVNELLIAEPDPEPQPAPAGQQRERLAMSVRVAGGLRDAWDTIAPVLTAIEERLTVIEERLGIPSADAAALRAATTRIEELRRAKEAAIDEQDFEQAAALRDQEKQTLRERGRLRAALSDVDDEGEEPGVAAEAASGHETAGNDEPEAEAEEPAG